MTARFEWVEQAVSAVLNSRVRNIDPGRTSAALAGGKMLDRGNTAVTRVWENPEMAIILSGNQDGTSESCLTRTLATRHWRASANRASTDLASANRASADLA